MTKPVKATTPATTPATTFDTIGAFKSIGFALANIEKSTGVIESTIAALREAKVVVGKSKKDMVRAQLLDALKEAFPERSEKTLANYMTSLAASINDGVPFSKSSSKGSTKDKSEETDGEEQGKAKSKKEPTALDVYVAKVFNHDDFAEFAAYVQDAFENAEADNIAQAIGLWLAQAGYDLPE